jgi:hypothetical protein
MSRTNPDGDGKLSSPISYYFVYKGDKGHFERWDKAKEQNVIHESLELILVDSRYSITGWNDASKGKIYSNLIKDSRSEPLTVRVGKQILTTGIYQAIKPQVKGAGGKYSVNLFCLVKDGQQWITANVIFSASVLSNWSDYVKEKGIKNIYSQKLTISRGEQKTKGAIKWYALKIEAVQASGDLCTKADNFDTTSLSLYLNQYKSNSTQDSYDGSTEDLPDNYMEEEPDETVEMYQETSAADKGKALLDLIRGHKERLSMSFEEVNVVSKRLFNDPNKIVAKLSNAEMTRLEARLNEMGTDLGAEIELDIPF